MSKYSDFKEWMAANTAKTEDEKVALLEASVSDGSGAEMQQALESREECEDVMMTACLCITYADHMTAKMQAEVDALKAAQTWQPIETAPAQGYFKAWHDTWGCEITVQLVDDLWVIEKTKTTKWPIEAFSHWQPLPTPPQETAK